MLVPVHALLLACAAMLAALAPAQVEWRTIPTLHSRFAPALTFDPVRQRTVLFGGAYGSFAGTIYLSDTWEWDGRLWERRPTVGPSARYGAALAWDMARGVGVLFGGVARDSVLADTWEWDGSAWTQRSTSLAPSPRHLHTMAYDTARQRTVLFGGSAILGELGDTWEWDGSTWTQLAPVPSPPARSQHGMAWDAARGVVVLFGGTGVSGALRDTWEWNGVQWTQRSTATEPPASRRTSMAYDASAGASWLLAETANGIETWTWDGTLWVRHSAAFPYREGTLVHDAARRRTVAFAQNPMLEWDGSRWIVRDEKPGANGGLGGTFLPSMVHDAAHDRILLFTRESQTWEWDGQRWEQRSPARRPGERARPGLAWDPHRQRAVLFGGVRNSRPLADTWEWDGTDWLQRFPATAPAAPATAVLAYDEQRRRTVLFASAPGVPATTWEWDGASWEPRTSAHLPPYRTDHDLAYDAARSVVVLHGGVDRNDTWEWDGVDWRECLPTNVPPASRLETHLEYDRARQRVVLLTGWEWDGIDWSQRYPTGRPCAGQSYGEAYDPRTERIVVFGGYLTVFSNEDVCSYGPVHSARLTAFGSACPSTAGTPRLEALGNARPWLGDRLTLELSGIPAGSTALLLGFSNTAWGSLRLPLDLSPLGMPGCALLVRPDHVLPGAAARWSLSVPDDPALLGAEFYVQGKALDAGANALGVVTSNGLAGVIGGR